MLKLKKLMDQKGFTLVELLIVIAVIGILAVAVLAALDPVEQLKKSRDTSRFADARELVSAYQRYTVGNRCFPDEQPTVGGTCTAADLLDTTLSPTWAQFAKLETAGELKSTYKNKQTVKAGELHIFHTGDVVSVCFNAESKNGRTGGMGQIYTVTTGTTTTIAAVSADSTQCDNPYTPATLDSNCTICIQ